MLSSLAESDKHGYAIMRDVEEFAGVRLGPGTLYGAISRLDERGWIRGLKSGDRRQPYTLTAQGRAHLAEELSRIEMVLRAGKRRLGKV